MEVPEQERAIMRPTLSTVLLYVLESRRRLWMAVVATTLLFGVFEFLVSRWMLDVSIAPNLHAALQAGIVGVGAGLTALLVLLGVLERRRIVHDELRRVAELNHAIRNSLEVIVLAHHGEGDYEHKAMVLDCTARIDQTLKKLYPVIARDQVATDVRKQFHIG